MAELRSLLKQKHLWYSRCRSQRQLADLASIYVREKNKVVSESDLSDFKTGRDDALRDDSLEAIAHVIGYKLELIHEYEDLSKLREELARLRAFEKRVWQLLDELKLPEELARFREFEKRVKRLLVDLKTVESKVR